jgi:hypothetical protein
MSNFDQTRPADRHRLPIGVDYKASRLVGRTVMSEADEFRLYAEETIRWASDCTDVKEKLVLMGLARTWLQAAGRSDSPWIAEELPPEHRAA